MKRKVAVLLLFAVLAAVLPNKFVSAFQPDRAYTYDSNSEAVPSANAFQTKLIVDETVMGCGRLNQPQDIFVDARDRVYILDSGNCRIVILNENYRCIKELKEFVYDNEILTLAPGAQGIFFREANQSLYIADTANDRILVSDLNGQVSRVYEKPEAELLDPELAYKPQKIVVDNMGIMYITSGNVNTGALLVDSDNNFLGFYGTNAIKKTWRVIVEYIWRSILTDEQNAQSGVSFQPTEFNNLFWSEKRFIYAVSPSNENIESPVVKLNAVGDNVFDDEIEFGDLADSGNNTVPVFSDITVDDDGVFTILDTVSGKLFQYDHECNLLAVFGGLGYQKGLFSMPTSIESNSYHDILVLDEVKNSITVMEQTYYGRMIREATMLYNEGLYEEAIEPWNEVIRINANYYLAYGGLGKAYMSMGEYQKAMASFKQGGLQDEFAEAKRAFRSEVIRENFALIAVIVIIIMIAVLGDDFFKQLIKKLCRRYKGRKGGERV